MTTTLWRTKRRLEAGDSTRAARLTVRAVKRRRRRRRERDAQVAVNRDIPA